jgi:hypothetical protein
MPADGDEAGRNGMGGNNRVVARIESCWQAVRGEVEGLDLAAMVYPDPPWTVRDVLLHCAFWNGETVKGIEAFRNGETYLTDTGAASFAEGMDAMNQRVVEANRSVPDDEVWARWVAAQDAVTDAARGLDEAELSRELTCPWHERGTLEQMLDDELGHEQNHIADIVTAVSVGEPAS